MNNKYDDTEYNDLGYYDRKNVKSWNEFKYSIKYFFLFSILGLLYYIFFN